MLSIRCCQDGYLTLQSQSSIYSCTARLPFEFRVALSLSFPVSAPHTVYISVFFPLTISIKLQTTPLTSSCEFQTPTRPHFFILYAQKSPKGTFKWLHGGFSHY